MKAEKEQGLQMRKTLLVESISHPTTAHSGAAGRGDEIMVLEEG
jgi:hypothetical protein